MGVRAGVNRLTGLGKLPVFGEPPSDEEFYRLTGSLCFEMMWCTRTTPGGSAANTVNILHASPDVDSAEAEMTWMINFMKARGFVVNREPRHEPPDWHHVDVLVLGTDSERLPNLGAVLEMFVYRVGLVPYWDVLLYGTKQRIATQPKPPEHPLCSGPHFGLDGACMLHAHIMLRDDRRFWEGFFAYMAIELETYVDRIISRPEKDLNGKIRRLESDFREANLYGDDAMLFLAAAHLLRSLRNAFVHSQRNTSAEERQKRVNKISNLFREFRDAASNKKRGFLLLGTDAHVGDLHGQIKYYTRLSLIARRWAHDLSKMVGSGRPV